MAYAYKEKRSSPLVRMWLSPQCTYWTLGWLIAGSLVIGLFPQLPAAEAAQRSGLPARLEVNHPYAASWGEQYYLTSYDMQSGQPQYCVVQIVREPLKYLMLAGIIMMLCGACLLFLAGPNAQKNGPSETSRPRETYNKCVQG